MKSFFLAAAWLATARAAEDVEEEWDYEEIVTTIPAAEAFRPAEESGCSM